MDNDYLDGFKVIWSELGRLLDEAEHEDESLKYREDVSTLRHFWSQLGSVINHVEVKRNPVTEES